MLSSRTFSSRRFAQLGLGAAGLVLVASMAVLMSGSPDGPAAAESLGVARVSPVAQPRVPSAPANTVGGSASAKL